MADPFLGDRRRDTFAVLRAVGVGGVASAAVRRATARARSLLRRAEHLAGAPPPPTAPWFAGALRAMPSPLAEDPDDERLALLEDDHPGARRAIVARAHEAAARLRRAETPLWDGHILDAHDPRLRWEPARLAPLVSIAAGVRATRDDGEADALRGRFEEEAIAWLEAHPAGAGSVWASPLEAALRAWNLWVATALARPERLSELALRVLAAAFVEHGRFVARNLEDRGLVVGSHLTGGLVGLYACGAALRSAGPEPAAWRRTARAGLELAARRQVLPDGGGAEGSTGYARFVVELWIAALVTARAVGEPPPAGVESACARMLANLTASLGPDGRDVGIGDDDDSRVLPPAARPARELTALIPFGPALAGAAERPEGIRWSEEAAWLCGVAGARRFRAARVVPLAARYHATSFGLHLARRGGLGGDLVALRAGPHGQGGAGGHAHNDALSITLWLDGVPVVIDPGTGLYLGRRAWRDRFRGVAAHATVCVDGAEPSPILPTRPFALPDVARARAVETSDDGQVWRCEAVHDGYRRLGVQHRREVQVDRAARRIVVTDRLLGVGVRSLALSFPLAGGASLVDGGVRIERMDGGAAWLQAADAVRRHMAWRLDPGPASPAYGAIVPGVVARRVGRMELPVTLITVITTRS